MATIEESLVQDAAAVDESVYAISVGDGFKGMLDSRFDEDWIRVELVAGKSYDIRLQGIGLDAVEDTVLKISIRRERKLRLMTISNRNP